MGSGWALRVGVATALLGVAGLACVPAFAQSGDGSVTGAPLTQTQRQRPVAALPENGVTLVPQDVATLQIAAGMLLRFSVFDAQEMNATLRVGADGTVTIPLAGTIAVGGKTIAAAKLAMEEALVKGEYFVRPQVSLDVLQVAPGYLTVVGEVQAPGRFQMLAPITLQAALAQAGGESQDAGAVIDIHRAGAAAEVLEHVSNARADQDKFAAVLVGPGDSVTVRHAGVIYVLGAVHRPGGYLMVDRGSLDVLQALALAQGSLLEAANDSIRVLHREGDKVTEESFHLGAASKGKEAAPMLHDTDIVYVPPNVVKSALVNGSAIIGAAASSIIYRAY